LDFPTLSTKRSKRWNGDLATLSPEFMTEVIEKMRAYGDRVQFTLPGKAMRPNYQVINSSNRKMGFDDRHLLLRPNADGNISDELTDEYSLDAIIEALEEAKRPRPRGRSATRRSTTAVRRSTATAVSDEATDDDWDYDDVPAPRRVVATPQVDVDAIERERYAYYREYRDTFPEGITRYAQDIGELMRQGMNAEQAFNTVIQQHFME